MTTALPLLVNIPTLQTSSSAFSQSQVCGCQPIAMKLGYGGRSKRGAVGVARMAKGENDVFVVKHAKYKVKETKTKTEEEEPLLLRIGVSLVTELLRVFSAFGRAVRSESVEEEASSPPAVGNQNVVEMLREDYARAYFLTGDFTTSLYDQDCLFADPTIQFRGRDKYQRNLKLLVPFFEEPRLTLFDIEEKGLKEKELTSEHCELQGLKEKERSINANWNLRTYLRLPWKPLIDVDGSTLYVIDANSKIVKHIESWSISGGQVVQQLFVPSDRAFGKES